MSCGSPGRLKTVRFAIRSFIAGFAKWNASVPMIPGHDRVRVIPCRPPSIASVFVSPSRPAFVVEYDACPKPPSVPATEAMLTMRPHPLLHVRPDGLRAVEGAGQVDAKVPLPERRVLVVELADVVERARVVDEDVDGAELVDRAGDRRRDLVAVGDVALDRERAAAHRADLLGGGLRADEALRPRDGRERPVLVRLLRELRLDEQVGDDDVGAGACERQRVHPAEAARAAGDERDPPAEIDLDRHQSTRGRKISLAITSRWI